MKTIAEHILDSYQIRPCFLCGQIGPCSHREPKVEGAFIEAQWLKQRKPPLSLVIEKKKSEEAV